MLISCVFILKESINLLYTFSSHPGDIATYNNLYLTLHSSTISRFLPQIQRYPQPCHQRCVSCPVLMFLNEPVDWLMSECLIRPSLDPQTDKFHRRFCCGSITFPLFSSRTRFLYIMPSKDTLCTSSLNWHPPETGKVQEQWICWVHIPFRGYVSTSKALKDV